MASDRLTDGLTGGMPRGRGASLNPRNRFEPVGLHVSGAYLDQRQADGEDQARQYPTQVYADQSRTIINRIDPCKSPDIPFQFTINPYRGCEHGCIYCYARPTHENLGFSCGLDFETKIMAKFDAPRLLRDELSHPRWRGEPIAMCGVTDAYQPAERQLRLTRACLETMARCRQPVSIVTKSALVQRDADQFKELATFDAAHVTISITTLDASLAAKLEPRAASPQRRLAAMAALAQAGVPVSVMAAPIIPGLTDREMPAILEAAAAAGASGAGYVVLRLPREVKTLFAHWLSEHYPDRAGHVLSLVRQMRGGALSESTPFQRMRGSGPMAEQIRRTFEVFRQRLGLAGEKHALSSHHFDASRLSGQGCLF